MGFEIGLVSDRLRGWRVRLRRRVVGVRGGRDGERAWRRFRGERREWVGSLLRPCLRLRDGGSTRRTFWMKSRIFSAGRATQKFGCSRDVALSTHPTTQSKRTLPQGSRFTKLAPLQTQGHSLSLCWRLILYFVCSYKFIIPLFGFFFHYPLQC